MQTNFITIEGDKVMFSLALRGCIGETSSLVQPY